VESPTPLHFLAHLYYLINSQLQHFVDKNSIWIFILSLIGCNASTSTLFGFGLSDGKNTTVLFVHHETKIKERFLLQSIKVVPAKNQNFVSRFKILKSKHKIMRQSWSRSKFAASIYYP